MLGGPATTTTTTTTTTSSSFTTNIHYIGCASSFELFSQL